MSAQVLMKAFGAILIVSGAAGYGVWLARQYGKRLAQLEQLRQMIFLLKGQILYANAPVPEALEAVGRRTQGVLSELFLSAAERIGEQYGEPFFELWKEQVEQLGKKGREDFALTASDRQSLAALGEHLGFLDKSMQERTLLLYLEELDLQIGDLREHKPEKCRLYTSLGVMGGMFLAILLV